MIRVLLLVGGLLCLSCHAYGYDFSPYCPKAVNGYNKHGRDITKALPHEGPRAALHKRYKLRSEKNATDLLFLGDSMVELFPESVFKESFQGFRADRYGISGDTVEHLIWRLEKGELRGLHPKVVVLMIGTNNAGIHSHVEIGQGIQRVVHLIHQELPKTHILLMNVFPAGKEPKTGYRRQLRCINQAIKPLDQLAFVTTLEFGAMLLTEEGEFRKDLTSDFLHLNPKGYRLFAAKLRPHLTPFFSPLTAEN